MDRRLVVGYGLILGAFAAWTVLRVDQLETASDLSFLEEAMSQIENQTIDPVAVINHPQVRAFLALIRAGEGTSSGQGYRMHFGGSLFTSYADHPRRAITRSGLTSTAAGAYQFLSRTWDEMASKYRLADFSPANQDVAAVGLVKRRGALADVLAGRFRAAIEKCNKEWASLPGSPYGQPTLSFARAQSVLLASGAEILGTVA